MNALKVENAPLPVTDEIVSKRFEILSQFYFEIPADLVVAIPFMKDDDFEAIITELEDAKNIEEFYQNLDDEDEKELFSECVDSNHEEVFDQWYVEMLGKKLEMLHCSSNCLTETPLEGNLQLLKCSSNCLTGAPLEGSLQPLKCSDRPVKVEPKSTPCKFGKKCRFLAAGTCVFSHSIEKNEKKVNPKSIPCKFGKKCRFLAEGKCTFAH